MRPEMNPLDLNNLPEEYLREGKQILEGSSTLHIEASDTTRGCRKKKSGGKNECGKVYECRFCSLKFCKSQALGGHMNRHRQERETETLNRARQLVFSNDNLVPQGGPHLGFRDPNLGTVQAIQPGNVNQSGNIGDPSLPFRSVYPTRMFSGSPSTINISQSSTPNQPYHYTSPSSRLSSFPSHYPPQMENDYFVSSHRHPNPNYTTESNYTCIGAPLGRDFQPVHGAVRGTDLSSVSGTSEDRSLQNQDDGVNWGRNYGGSQRINPSSINRFHGGY